MTAARGARKPNARVIYQADLSVEYFTPLRTRELVYRVLGGAPDLDPCTIARNPLGAARFFTKRMDAKRQVWWPAGSPAPTVYMNPPYGLGINWWVGHFAELAIASRARMLALVPARVGSRWYERFTCASQCFVELRGRLRFELRTGKPAPFNARWGALLVYFGPERASVARMLAPFGAVRMVNPSQRAPRVEVIDPRQLPIAIEQANREQLEALGAFKAALASH